MTSEVAAVDAVRDLTFAVASGELTSLVGPSGCGKTTLLRWVAGPLPPSAGEVRVDGDVVTGPPEQLAVVFAAVDAQTRADLEDLIRSVWRTFGMTVLFVTHDIDEAVYLGGRVPVLSASPTVVLEGLAVDLPDERDRLTIRSEPRFAQLRTHVYEQIQRAKARDGMAAYGA